VSTPALVALSPVELLLRVSAATVGAGEFPPNSNAGPYVQRVQRSTGNRPPDPWCASYVTDVGLQALGTLWPVRRSASVVQLCEWAKAQGCRYIPGTLGVGVPQPGDLYALWYPKLGRWAHVGIVLSVEAGTLRVQVRDGNTSSPGATPNAALDRDGWLVAEKRRTLTRQDRLIRWWELLTPELVAAGAVPLEMRR
jgi:hypothetical protein